MNRHRTLLLVIVGLGLACGIEFLLWSKKTSLVELKIVRRAVEQGRSVVFFRVNGAEKGLMVIDGVYKIEDGKVKERLVRGADGLFGRWGDFSPLAIIDPLDDTNRERREFGVIAPTNVPVWSLQAQVFTDDPSLFKRFSIGFSVWWSFGKESVLSALRRAWNAHAIRTENIASDPITNAVAPEASSKAMQ
jgi:hypothetical protein